MQVNHNVVDRFEHGFLPGRLCKLEGPAGNGAGVFEGQLALLAVERQCELTVVIQAGGERDLLMSAQVRVG